MDLVTGLFWVICSMIVVTASFVAFRPRPVESAMWLILNFFLTSALYVLLGSHFVAVIQVLVYAGAIVVLFIFVLFLLNLDHREKNPAPISWVSLVIFLGFLSFVMMALKMVHPELMAALPPIEEEGFGTIENFSRKFLADYIWGFEVAGFLLLMAIVGVGLLAYRKPYDRLAKQSGGRPS